MECTTLPKISIIMPVLNRGDTIQKALASIIDQHYPNLELIIIDGGSTDETLSVIRQYEQHISYWHSKPDGSAVVAMNVGIGKATGDVVAILMADDWYEPGILKKIAEVFVAQPDVDVVTCGGRIVYHHPKHQVLVAKHTYANAKRMQLNFTNICLDITSAICCRFIRRSLYERIGVFHPYDAAGKHMFSNDKEFLMRAVLANAKEVYVGCIGHNYLAHPESSTFGNNKANIIRLCQEHMQLAEFYLHRKNLSKKQRLLLIYWYNDQSTRLLLYKLLQGDVRAALSTAVDGLRKYNLLWPVIFTATFCQIVVKRSLRLLRGKIAPKLSLVERRVD